MNKTELIASIAQKSTLTKKDSECALSATLDVITESLQKGESVQIIGFGSFEVRERAARAGRNPQTGEEILISESKTPAFRPGKALKDAVK